MDAKIKIVYRLSDEYRRTALVERGEKLDQQQTLELDLTANATPAERAAIVAYVGMDLREMEIVSWSNISWGDRTPTNDHILLDAVPTITDVVQHCLRMQAERAAARKIHDETMLQKIEADIAEKMQIMRESLADGRDISRNADLATYLADDRKRLDADLDLSDYNDLRVQYDALVAVRKLEIAADHEAYEERKRQEAAAAAQAKLDWIAEHGSEHLRRAIAAGHDCKRMYLIERAALEYPGYVLDYEDDAEWTGRSCPSVVALDERDRVLAAQPDATVEIVWLKSEPHDQKQERDEWDGEPFEWDGEPFGEREAVGVLDPTYAGKWLVK